MKGLTFREPALSDIEDLVVLMGQLGYPIEPDEMRKNVLEYASLEAQKAWVALIDSKVVGCIAVAITKYFHREGSFLRIITMVVHENNRRAGIGKQLMNIAEEYAKKMQCSHIELTSGVHRKILGAHDFYQSLGYSELNDLKKYFGKRL